MSKTMFAEADKLFYTSWKESSGSKETKFTKREKGFLLSSLKSSKYLEQKLFSF